MKIWWLIFAYKTTEAAPQNAEQLLLKKMGKRFRGGKTTAGDSGKPPSGAAHQGWPTTLGRK